MRLNSVLLLFAGVLGGQTLEEQAIQISAAVQARHMPFGTVLNPMYASAQSSELAGYTRCGDSAIWTGHYLAAESFRYAVTKSPQALEAARKALKGVEALVDVTGSNNLVARCLVPDDSPYAAGLRREEAHHGEYAGRVDGINYHWIANISRDQYMGVFFGASVAYELIDDASIRSSIKDRVTRLVNRLLDKEWSVIMPDGDRSTVFWLRPDQQLSILQVARQVNPERFASIYESMRRSNNGIELPIAIEVLNDHDSYFKFNLTAISLYNLIHLEEPSSPKRADYLSAYRIFRRTVAGHGNAHFNVIDRALTGAEARRDAETIELLAAWLQRSKRDEYVDLRGKYKACDDDRACEPIPVADRVRTDFLWQRSPYQLYGGGAGAIEGAGIDFILPYWMGRHYGMDLSLIAVSAASGASLLAPDSIASLYGAALAPRTQAAAAAPPDQLGGARVEIADAAGIVRSAPLFFASPGQINFLVPAGTALGPARLTVEREDGSRTPATVTRVDRIAPALFKVGVPSRPLAAATAIRVIDGRVEPVEVFRCLGTLLCFPSEIEVRDDRPVYLTLYGTGLRNRPSLEGVAVSVGGLGIPVLYAGPQGGFAGLDQVNVRLPAFLKGKGETEINLTVDGVAANPVRIHIK